MQQKVSPRPSRFILAAGAALLLTQAVFAPPLRAENRPLTKGSSSERPELAGLTIIETDGPSFVRIRLSQDVRIDGRSFEHRLAGPNSHIGIVGGGLFTGVVIVPDPYPDITLEGESLIAGQFKTCGKPACGKKDVFNYVQPYVTKRQPYLSLRAGNYRLYAITDGGPGRISLRFPGLTGRVELRPQSQASVDIQVPPTRVSNSANGSVLWSAGTDYEGGSTGFSLSLLYLKDATFRRGQVGVCQYVYPTAPPEEVAYLPGCSGAKGVLGGGADFSFSGSGKPEDLAFITGLGYHDQGSGPENMDGRYGLGTWFHVAGQVEDFGSIGMFVALE